MLSLRLLVKVLLALAPAASARPAQSSQSSYSLPSLLDATAEQLNAGLEAGQFTCVNLVDVRFVLSKSAAKSR